ncbi:MAG TPA: PCP reductase family protein [Longimicrobiales bacterium]|nr:PCP reductase family protein [Longimicrobiales bacterium]
MKFLCLPCDRVMNFAERQVPGDGTLAAVFSCASCGHEMAMLTNPMETQLVSSLGVRIGGRPVPEQPFEQTRSTLAGTRDDAFHDSVALEPSDNPPPTTEASPLTPGAVRWSHDAVERLARVPGFVRGMVKRIYAEWAAEHGVVEITPEHMDRARSDLGLEGM